MNVFKMGSRNPLLFTKSCARLPTAFLTGIISWFLDSNIQKPVRPSVSRCGVNISVKFFLFWFPILFYFNFNFSHQRLFPWNFKIISSEILILRFEFQPEHDLSSPRFYVIIFSPSSQVFGYYLDYVTNFFFFFCKFFPFHLQS